MKHVKVGPNIIIKVFSTFMRMVHESVSHTRPNTSWNCTPYRALDANYYNSYEHGLYIKVQIKETLICPVVRGRRMKKWMDEKNDRKFYLFIISY